MSTASLAGRTVVITGPTSGIGRAAAFELARRGAELALVCRNPAKGQQLLAELAAITPAPAPGASRRVFEGDLSVLKQVRVVADELRAGLPKIDVLVNNAGVAARSSKETIDGFDEMLAANYLGPFLLTHLLLDTVTASAPSRIVIVGSEAHRMAGAFDPERFENLGPYANPLAAQRAYGRTKLLDLLFADELARRLAGGSVTVNSLCPGFVATNLAGSGRVASTLRVLARTPLIYTAEDGARMTVRLASDPALEGVSGRFFSSTPGAGFVPTAGPRRDPAIARRVYERTCEMVDVSPVPG